jgi:uncharacterized protein
MDIVERICISVNTRCNLGCKYCYFYNPENRVNSEKDLSEDEIYQILLQINNYAKLPEVNKKIKINFVGSGEPLLSWKNIKNAVEKFKDIKSEKIKFYTVTNGTLITNEIAQELKQLEIFPSVSLDGYKELHNMYRINHAGKGSFDQTMTGINILKRHGFELAINTVASKTLYENIEKFFIFLKTEGIKKVIFDRIVDTPSFFKDFLSYDEYYQFLEDVYNTIKNLGLSDEIEVGNLEAYKRSFAGKPDKVCTMFGSSCGAGTNFIIYMGKDVYPCGRMFGKKEWILGNINDSITEIQKNMYSKIPKRNDCISCDVKKYCVRDCLLEYERKDYSCEFRKKFIKKLKNKL